MKNDTGNPCVMRIDGSPGKRYRCYPWSEEKQKLFEDRKEFAEKMLVDAEALADGWRLKFEDATRDYRVYVLKTNDEPKTVTCQDWQGRHRHHSS